MKRDLPEALKLKQEDKRKETLSVIQGVIDDLKRDGAVVTKKALIELSGYSASTFSKPHVKELLKKNQVCQFEKRYSVEKVSPTEEKQNRLSLQNEHLKRENALLKETIIKKDIRIDKLEKELLDLDDKYKRLIGKIHEIMRKAEIHGIKITE